MHHLKRRLIVSLNNKYPTHFSFSSIHFPYFLSSMYQLLILALLTYSKSQILLAQTPKLSIITDKQSLLSFMSQIETESSSNPLSDWDQNLSPCNWTGVVCNKNGERVVGLDLSRMELKGTISPYIGNLSFLESLELQNNQFTGPIPDEIGNLFQLRLLNMSHNNIQGELPRNMSTWVELKSLDLMQNEIYGSVPERISSLKNLQVLNLRQNKISGPIPPSVANISSLVVLNLGTNTLTGSIPSLASLRKLQILDLSINNLTGTLPEDIYNMSSLVRLVLASNNLMGEIPYDVGITLPNLLSFVFCYNRFTGTIPGSLNNLTNMEIIRMSDNLLHGSVPPGLGNLPKLQMYVIGYNNIVSSGNNGLDFLSSLSNSTYLEYLGIEENRLEGLIPENIGNLSKVLRKVFMGGNRIYGKIPSSIGDLSDLGVLSLVDNFISGEIPHEIGKLKNLMKLELTGNNLSGNISPSLNNASNFLEIDLSRNNLEGMIPSSLGNLQKLLLMDLSHNKLTGSIPKEIFYLPSLYNYLNLSNNFLNGSLPQEIGKLISIVTIDLSNNGFSGLIPDSIGQCKSLQTLDISSNNLSGSIPSSLELLQGLQFLNLSYNDLKGQVPRGGVFANASKYSLQGNPKLCSHFGCGKSHRHRRNIILISVSVVVSVILAMCFIISLYCYLRQKETKVRSSSESHLRQYQLITYEELRLATDNFNRENLIGRGSFGSVYRGCLEQNSVAVKVLDTDMKSSWKSFLAECMVLRNLRHRNLVKLITTCSSMDLKNMDFLALVYELMSKGSLEDWILGKKKHENGDGLSMIERLNVVIDVAYAIDYMHNECETRAVHCDIKPSNILLDEDMTAKVGDFGLAKFIIRNDPSSIGTTNGLMGSIGYIPPEYGMGEKPSPAGDVYSYGITLLELFTSKKPTDESFTSGLSLRKWVEMNLLSNTVEVLDSNLLPNKGTIAYDFLVMILGVGLSCTVDSSDKRTSIKDALYKLKSIRTTLLNPGEEPVPEIGGYALPRFGQEKD